MRASLSDKGKAGIASFLFFSVSLALTSYSSKYPGLGIGHSIIAEVIRPFSAVSYNVYDSATTIWDRYINLIQVKRQNEELSARLNGLESKNAELEESQKENIRLKKLLDAKAQTKSVSLAARVIAYDPSGWVQAITINRGSSEGIKEGCAVIEGAGVVGQVITVSPHTSRIMLIIDRASGVDSIVQDSRARGILEGTGSVPLDFKFVNESEEVKVGDKIITSGLDGIYPKGLVIGVVTQSGNSSGGLFKAIKVTPSVSFSKLEDVLVILPGES